MRLSPKTAQLSRFPPVRVAHSGSLRLRRLSWSRTFERVAFRTMRDIGASSSESLLSVKRSFFHTAIIQPTRPRSFGSRERLNCLRRRETHAHGSSRGKLIESRL